MLSEPSVCDAAARVDAPDGLLLRKPNLPLRHGDKERIDVLQREA